MITRRQNHAAFTIVELLVASAVTLGIVVLLGIIFSSITRTTSRANQRTDAFRDARAALQMMERDLTGLVRTQWDVRTSPVPTPTPRPMTRPTAFLALRNIYNDPGTVNPSATDNQQIYALISIKNGEPGDVCAVGYYCRWDSSKNSYNLCRFFTSSEPTYTNLNKTTSYAPYTDLYTPSPSDDIVASNVWSLRVNAYDGAGNQISYPYMCDPDAATSGQVPAVIEISFKAMSVEAARTIMSVPGNPNDWLDPSSTNYTRLIAPNVYEFRSRIQL